MRWLKNMLGGQVDSARNVGIEEPYSEMEIMMLKNLQPRLIISTYGFEEFQEQQGQPLEFVPALGGEFEGHPFILNPDDLIGSLDSEMGRYALNERVYALVDSKSLIVKGQREPWVRGIGVRLVQY